MNVVIFSKDRAMQLELLLRSIQMFFINYEDSDISIIYTYSNNDYKASYKKLVKMYPEFDFKLEYNFKQQLCDVIYDEPYTVFFTDDAVFKSKFDIDEIDKEFHDNICALSLMLGKNINYAYEEEREIKQPQFYYPYPPTHFRLAWDWKSADIDFNYPMSVIGCIWRTKDIKPKLLELDYDKAWNVESALKSSPIDKSKMTCYKESKVVHIANNVVSPCGNKSGGGDVEILNKKFLNGERIVWKKINNNSVHFEWEYKFERK